MTKIENQPSAAEIRRHIAEREIRGTISLKAPIAYSNFIKCLWLLQADANHSLVIDILDFTLEGGYDYLFIGLGHNQSNENSVVLELTGSIAPTRYYLGIQSYLQFVSDSSVSRSGFSLNATSIPFECK